MTGATTMRRKWRATLAVVVALLLVAAAGGAWRAGADDSGVALEPAFGGRVFEAPVEMVAYSPSEALVVEKAGLVLRLSLDGGDEAVALDLRERVATGHEELGLLSLALDPGFEANRHVWVYYMADAPLRSVLSRFTLGYDGTADPASELVVLEVEQPYPNHNGGAVRFGPDGMLYLGIGDGGHFGDPLGSGQDLATLLGSIIRIDVREAREVRPYRVPPDNPFLEVEGARPEIWAYGFRNPWRMSFDPATGDLWVGDVGQDRVEEVDLVVRGGNFGWSRVEGDRCYREGCDLDGTVAPVATYTHGPGCSVTGSVVYRGAEVSVLAGRYLYGDLCTGEVWALERGMRPERIAQADGPLTSFGTDAAGEVYVLQFGGPILRLVAE